jgi:hypothetical protein
MTEPEIAAALDALRESKDETSASFYICDLAKAMARLLPGPGEEYIESFSDHWEIVWRVTPGDIVIGGSSLYYTRYAGPSMAYQKGTIYGGQASRFSLVVSKLLVPEGSNVSGSVTIASVIRIPDPIVAELNRQGPDKRSIFARLDTLARVFRQIQTANARSASADEP